MLEKKTSTGHFNGEDGEVHSFLDCLINRPVFYFFPYLIITDNLLSVTLLKHLYFSQ